VSQREASVTWGGGHGWLASLCTLRAQCWPTSLTFVFLGSCPET
jgi:hypothetical protein